VKRREEGDKKKWRWSEGGREVHLEKMSVLCALASFSLEALSFSLIFFSSSNAILSAGMMSGEVRKQNQQQRGEEWGKEK
jgi:hypothetical protein